MKSISTNTIRAERRECDCMKKEWKKPLKSSRVEFVRNEFVNSNLLVIWEDLLIKINVHHQMHKVQILIGINVHEAICVLPNCHVPSDRIWVL